MRDYGLVRRCRLPVLDHGQASCRFHDLRPGTECKVSVTSLFSPRLTSLEAVCDPGWLASPGLERSRCLEGGEWDTDLQCERPVLVLAGGLQYDNRSSLEVVSLVEVEGCNFTIPAMSEEEGVRGLHNPGAWTGGTMRTTGETGPH